jgi:hypothetical protein
MADVLAKLLAAAPHLDEDDLDDDATIAIVAGAARDAPLYAAISARVDAIEPQFESSLPPSNANAF